MRWFIGLALLGNVALAAEVQLTHQARVLDAFGTPIDGDHTVALRLFGSASGSDLLFDEDFQQVRFDRGYVSLLVGARPSVPLDSSVFANPTGVWVEMTVDSAVITPRQPLLSVPHAAVATSVSGGTAEVSSLTVTGAGEVVLGQSTATTCTTEGALVYDPVLSAVKVCTGSSFVAFGIKTVTVSGGVHQWSDGSVAHSCEAYIRPATPDYLYAGSTGDGAYRIGPTGSSSFIAQCDMTTAGGGWTILHSVNGANGQQPLVSNTTVAGDPFTYGHYNTSQAQKVALSAISSETLFLRSNGSWLNMNRAPFDAVLVNNPHDVHNTVTLTARNGATTTTAVMGHASPYYSGGGDYGLRNGPFDHHSTTGYFHLQSSCVGHYLYSYSSTDADFDAGYDVNLSLGDWAATVSCDSTEGGSLVFRTQVR